MPHLSFFRSSARIPACAAFIRFHYKPVAGKKKVPFAKFGKFTIKFFEQPERHCRKRQQRKQNICPKGPQRAQAARQQRKVQHRAQQGRKQHEKPQLTSADAQRKEKRQQRQQQAVERIERAGECARCFPPQADRAQQIVEQRQRRAQQERGEEALRLRAERYAHRLSLRTGG